MDGGGWRLVRQTRVMAKTKGILEVSPGQENQAVPIVIKYNIFLHEFYIVLQNLKSNIE